MRQQEEQRGGEARSHPDAEDVEVGRVLHPLAALHRGHALASVHCPALIKWNCVIVECNCYRCFYFPYLLCQHAPVVEAAVKRPHHQLGVEVEPLEGVDDERKLGEVVPVELVSTLTQGVRLHDRLEVRVVETHLCPESHFSFKIG